MSEREPFGLRRSDRLKARVAELREALVEARPYVFNQTGGEDWRAETAQEILKRVDAALGKTA